MIAAIVIGLIAGLAGVRSAFELRHAYYHGQDAVLASMWAVLCWLAPAWVLAYAVPAALAGQVSVATWVISGVTVLLLLGDTVPRRSAG